MSDGMSDSRALGHLSGELEDAAYKLAEALIRARDGHRGLAIDAMTTVNDVLNPLGYRLQKKTQHEEWK